MKPVYNAIKIIEAQQQRSKLADQILPLLTAILSKIKQNNLEDLADIRKLANLVKS